VVFDIAPGYYLYREQLKFAATGATLGTPAIPPGKVKFDETFQKNVETHRDVLRIAVPVQRASGAFRIAVNYQGCADKGLCYPPMQMRADVSLVAFGGNGSVNVLPGRDMPIAADPQAEARGPGGVAAGLAGEGLAATLQNPWVLGAFALALVLLALSMFGVYELQLPSSVTAPLTGMSQRLPGGRFAGVFAMGGVSALIVSPCVAA